MQNRLCGREQEYGMRIDPARVFPKVIDVSGLSHSDDSDRQFINWRFNFTEAIIRNLKNLKLGDNILNTFSIDPQRIWLENGSLVYIDLGCILEVATAEARACSLDGVLQEKASEWLLNKVLPYVVSEKGVKSITLYKNNVGPAGSDDIYQEVAYASHHNYSYLTVKQLTIFKVMESFVPASLILSGNGHVYRHRSGDFIYALSQRAPHITECQSLDTLKNRAIINIRDESLMDPASGLSRLHLIARDATRCEFQTWLVDGVTHLVLRLVEEGWELPYALSLFDPVSELHAINSAFGINLDYKVACGLLGFSKVNLLDYNKIFLDASKKLPAISEEERAVLEAWEEVLELLAAKAFAKLVGKLDWVTKWYLLKNQMQKHSFGLNDIRAWKINIGYHDISDDPQTSWFALLDESGWIEHLVDEKEIEKAAFAPPETRAKSRGKFIRLASENLALYDNVRNLNWDKVFLKGKPRIFNFLGELPIEIYNFGVRQDPFITVSPELEILYKELGLA